MSSTLGAGTKDRRAAKGLRTKQTRALLCFQVTASGPPWRLCLLGTGNPCLTRAAGSTDQWMLKSLCLSPDTQMDNLCPPSLFSYVHETHLGGSEELQQEPLHAPQNSLCCTRRQQMLPPSLQYHAKLHWLSVWVQGSGPSCRQVVWHRQSWR